MTSTIRLKGRDYGPNGGELTSFRAFIPTVTAANFAAQSAALDALQTAVNDVCSGTFNGKQMNAVDVPVAGQASNPDAQRERKWRVSYVDTVDPIGDGSFEIGMADSTFLAANSEDLDAATTEGAALINAIETNLVSRLGNAIVVSSVKLVGRST